MTDVSALNAAMAALAPAARLEAIRAAVPGRLVFTTSFGIEDQYLTHLIFESGLTIDVVTLDTGRLFPETTTVWHETEMRYGKRIRAVYPERAALETLIEDQGIDGQYLSIAARKACCDVRKVEPLKRALAGAAVWITGLRASQSANRSGMAFVARDDGFGLIKVNPLLDLSREAIVEATTAHNVPVNALHGRGFPSIGCAPCTRAIGPGEDERAGRWWWESEDKKECGLHVTANGVPVRAIGVSA
ncbi:MAG: phosphoadenylyl-sulfate reductase [Proteobacteria bacterium]|nr:phosphoadenylyl-sulfate reductase [Pseudomonadota bacterium]